MHTQTRPTSAQEIFPHCYQLHDSIMLTDSELYCCLFMYPSDRKANNFDNRVLYKIDTGYYCATNYQSSVKPSKLVAHRHAPTISFPHPLSLLHSLHVIRCMRSCVHTYCKQILYHTYCLRCNPSMYQTTSHYPCVRPIRDVQGDLPVCKHPLPLCSCSQPWDC